MLISSATGIVLDLFVSRYQGFALLAVVISGLPGAVGAIFTSRLSTRLHAAALALPGGWGAGAGGDGGKGDPSPSPKLVMAVLLLVTLPVEIIFLAIIHSLGWLRLPLLFVGFSIVFFCAAVRPSMPPSLLLLTDMYIGPDVPLFRACADQLPLGAQPRSGYVCAAHPFSAYGSDRAAPACAVL